MRGERGSLASRKRGLESLGGEERGESLLSGGWRLIGKRVRPKGRVGRGVESLKGE